MHDAQSEELATLWKRIREELRSSLPASTFRIWVEPLHAASIHGDVLYVSAPPGVKKWVERRYAGLLARAVRRHTISLQGVELLARPEASEGSRRLASDTASTRAPNPAHSFERFVIGQGNRLAHAAALAVAELPGEAYNPLFLHGAPGLGKSHLLGAVANYVLAHHPELTLRYTTGERFTAEFIAALRAANPEPFKRRHRDVNVLLIDDIQFLEGKSRTEEEFFHTFNALHEEGGQIVVASDRPPAALSRIADRLRDRFQWGLCAELSPPDLPTRMTALANLSARMPLPSIPAEVVREIAALVPDNLRRLEGALTRVVALSSVTGEDLNPDLVRSALTSRAGHRTVALLPSGKPSVTAVQEAVCAVLHLSRDDLLSPNRTPRAVRARQLAMYLTRELTGLSTAQIGRDFYRDHTTVMHAIRRIGAAMQPDSELHQFAAEVRSLLRAPAD